MHLGNRAKSVGVKRGRIPLACEAIRAPIDMNEAKEPLLTVE